MAAKRIKKRQVIAITSLRAAAVIALSCGVVTQYTSGKYAGANNTKEITTPAELS
jgi:hypothetical protein